MTSLAWWEVRYLIAAPALLWLYWQYALYYFLLRWRAYTWPLWLPLGLAFAAQNALFNATFATFIFWERPRQWFFSDRIRAMQEGTRKERFRRLLNAHDPDHIK